MELKNFNNLKPKVSFSSVKIPLAVLTLIILIYALIIPKLNNVIKNTKKIGEKKIELTTLETKENELKKLESDYKKNIDNIAKIKESIPEDKNTSDFAVQIEALALNNGLLLKTLKFPEQKKKAASTKATEETQTKGQSQTKKTPVAQDTSNEISFEITITGDFNKTQEFIRGIEALVRFTDVRSLEIDAGGNAVTVNLSGIILKQK